MMSSPNGKLSSLCGTCGVLVVAGYLFGAVLELPVPDGVSLAICFGFPAFGTAQWHPLRARRGRAGPVISR